MLTFVFGRGRAMSWQTTLKDKVVIVTGAGKGLGRAYALDLAKAGATVIVNNRWKDQTQPASADAVVAEIVAGGGKALASHHPAEDSNSGEDMVKLALEEFGRLDAVIANAGVPEAATFGRISVADFRSVFDINFFGTLYIVHAAWKVFMGQKRGRVVVSTSAAGLHGNRGMAAYSSSKAALIGLMRALSVEGENAGVRINAIAPYAATAMTESYLDEATIKRMRPEAVAPVVSWLASDACDVSGRTFVAGAGRLRRGYTVEGPVVQLGDDIPTVISRALQPGAPVEFAQANAAFSAFMTTSASA